MIVANLPALQVVIPLVAAPICALVGSGRIAFIIACLASFSACIISLLLAYNVLIGTPVSYDMGGWQPPFGIEYRVDILNAFILVIVSTVAAISSVYSYYTVKIEIDKNKRSLFYAAFLLCFAGLLGMTITNDAFNVYVFLEIASLATYALISMGSDRRALLSSFEYLILGTIGATFILIAIGLLYMMTGTLNFSDLALRVPSMLHMTPIKAALAFFIVGLALKIAIFPLHLWLANSYTNAPSFVSVFLSATASKVGIYVLIRIIFFVFGYKFVFQDMKIASIMTTLSIAAILVCSLVAVFQNNVKRMLAYSSVAQIGYIILGLSLMTHLGVSAALIHIFNHAIAKAALFMAVGCFLLRVSSAQLSDLKGIGRKMPITMAAFLTAGLSLIAIPLTGGFVSKWYLLSALIEKDMWPVFFIILLSSVLALIYIWKVVEVAYFEEINPDNKDIKEAPYAILIPLWMMTSMTVIFGIYTQPITVVATRISKYLLSL